MTRKRIGMITPSLNTVLEPLTHEMLTQLPDVTAHFSRVHVTHISLSQEAAKQFQLDPMIRAARLLADARVDAICWNGTAGSWLGLGHDRALCEAIARATHIPATSASLAITELLRASNTRHFGLVTPFQTKIQDAIIRTYQQEGFECISELHANSPDGFGYANIPDHETESMIRTVAEAKPHAIAAVCTNFSCAAYARQFEQKAGIPLFDSVAAALWGTLILAGVDPNRIRGWGHVFTVRPKSKERLGTPKKNTQR